MSVSIAIAVFGFLYVLVGAYYAAIPPALLGGLVCGLFVYMLMGGTIWCQGASPLELIKPDPATSSAGQPTQAVPPPASSVTPPAQPSQPSQPAQPSPPASSVTSPTQSSQPAQSSQQTQPAPPTSSVTPPTPPTQPAPPASSVAAPPTQAVPFATTPASGIPSSLATLPQTASDKLSSLVKSFPNIIIPPALDPWN